MGLFHRSEPTERNGYVPLWKNPDACAAAPAEPDTEPHHDDSLNRLQRSLIWFAAVLIAVSMFENFQNNF